MALLRGPASTADMATQAKPDLAHRTRRLTKMKRHPVSDLPAPATPRPRLKRHPISDLPTPASPRSRKKLTPSQKARVRPSKNATAGDGRLERPAPRYNLNAGRKADEMVQGDAGSDYGDLRTYARKRLQINRQFFGARVYRGKPDGNA